jgi:hypothetical protein
MADFTHDLALQHHCGEVGHCELNGAAVLSIASGQAGAGSGKDAELQDWCVVEQGEEEACREIV